MSRIIQNLRQFKLVTFDITDTLLRFRRHPAIEYAKVAASLGYPEVNQEKVNDQFKVQFKYMHSNYPNFGRTTDMNWKHWWEMLIIRIFQASEPSLSKNEIKRISDRLIELYSSPEPWEKIQGADEIVTIARENVASVGVISNFDPRLNDLVVNIDLPKFDFIVNSYDGGAAKPSVKIFNHAINRAQSFTKAMPYNSLHMGDGPIYDYIGARHSGWYSLLFANNSNEWKNVSEVKENHVFRNIPHLIETLDKEALKWD